MNSAVNIYQCPACQRQLVREEASGQLVPLDKMVFCVPTPLECGLPDCGEVQAEFQRREKAVQTRRMERRRERYEAKQECRAASRPKPAPARGEPPCRLPYRDTELAEEVAVPAPQPLTQNLGEALARVPAGSVVEPAMDQPAFVASGQADSQNAKLLEFFSQPHNFNKWFKSTFLEELSGATRMNNRAVDLRPVFIARGHYIDNCMITDTHTDRKASHYRVCNIDDALSLTAEQKANLIQSK